MTQFILLIMWVAWDGEAGSVVSGFETQAECNIALVMMGEPPDRYEIRYYHKECVHVKFSEVGEKIALVWNF